MAAHCNMLIRLDYSHEILTNDYIIYSDFTVNKNLDVNFEATVDSRERQVLCRKPPYRMDGRSFLATFTGVKCRELESWVLKTPLFKKHTR